MVYTESILNFNHIPLSAESIIEIADLHNLSSIVFARTITSLYYIVSGNTLSEKKFYKQRAVIHKVVYSTVKPYEKI